MIEPFDLNLRHLRAVPLIVRHGNLGAAAAAAGLSQPALTQGLSRLEARLGVVLFDRRPQGMAATEAGAAFATRVDAAFAQLAGAGGGTMRGFARPDRLMTATQLKAFLALASAGSFVEAARTTGGAQAAIHRAVRDLEQIGAWRLAERRGRGVVLTPDGRRLARAARLARAEFAAAIADLAPGGDLGGRVVIGAMPLSRARLLPAALATLLRAAPAASFDVVEGAWRELVELLRDGQLDLMLGALRDDPGPPDLDQVPLLVDRLAVVARAGHPLAGGGPVGRDALARYPWIVGRTGAPLRHQWEVLFAAGPRPPAPIECGSVMTIRGILVVSDCLTLLSPDQVAMETATGLLAVLPTPGAAMARTIGLTTRRGWCPTRLQQHLVDALEVAAQAG